jgi:Ala-tRNA(Pro) deacylase
MPLGKNEMLGLLGARGIDYTLHEHEAVFTAEEALRVCGHIPGVHCKNLFLKAKPMRCGLSHYQTRRERT